MLTCLPEWALPCSARQKLRATSTWSVGSTSLSNLMSSIHLVGVTVDMSSRQGWLHVQHSPPLALQPHCARSHSKGQPHQDCSTGAIALHVFRQCGPYSVAYQGRKQCGSCSGGGHTRADEVSVLVCLQMLLVDRGCIRVQQLMIRHVDLQALLMFSAEHDHCTGIECLSAPAVLR